MAIIQSILLFLEIVILIINLIGNSIVLYVMTRPQKLRRRSNFYIISITIANLLIGLFIVSYSIHSALSDPEKTHFFVCRLVCSATLFLFSVSYFCMVAVSIDRYFAIRHHLFYRKEIGTKFTLLSIAFCWIFGLIGFGPVLGWNAEENSCGTRIFLEFDFVIVFCVFASFIPTVILVVLYGTIYKTIYDQAKIPDAVVTCNSSQSNEYLSNSKRELEPSITLSLIIAAYVLCCLPLTIGFFVFAITEDREFDDLILKALIALTHVNTAIDPIILALRITDVYSAMRNIITCSFKELSQPHMSLQEFQRGTTLEAVAFVLGVFGNLVVLYVMTRERKLRRKSNYFIISIAVADFLICAIGIPSSIYVAHTQQVANQPTSHQRTICLWTLSFEHAIGIVSFLSIAAVSVDRFFAICYPIEYNKTITRKKTMIAVALCWLIGIIGFSPAAGWNTKQFAGICQHETILEPSFIIFLSLSVGLIPTIIIIVTFSLVFRKIFDTPNIRPEISVDRKNNSTEYLSNGVKEFDATKTLFMVAVTFIVCWLPLTMVSLISALDIKKVHPNWTIFCIFISHANSALDPVIYAVRIIDVRDAMIRAVTCGQAKGSPQYQTSFSELQRRISTQTT